MNVQQMKDLVRSGNVNALENGMLDAASQGMPPEQLGEVLEGLVATSKKDEAATLAWAIMADRGEALPPADALIMAKALLLAVPNSQELRQQTVELYRKVHGHHAHFDAMLDAAGLKGGQSPKRAVRTLDTCIAIEPGFYLANRFDGQVYKAQQFNDIMGEFELLDAAGHSVRMEPKLLADEFDIVNEMDFRVLCQHRTDQLEALLGDNPAGVLIGICASHGGRTDSIELKDMLVPRFLTAKQWTDWWSKARTAAKRSPNLVIEGRNPVTISYHASGQTLEQELARAVVAAKMPLEKLSLLHQYIRDARDRKVHVDAAFAAPIVDALAEQAASFKDKRPADALAASLAVEELEGMGIARPSRSFPAPQEIVDSTAQAADAVATLADSSLWFAAVECLEKRPDADVQLEKLLKLVPAAVLDDLAARLLKRGRHEAVAAAAATAIADIHNNLELFAWLWKGPAQPVTTTPSKGEMLSRMLKTMLDLEHDWDIPPSIRKTATQRLRAALTGGDYATFRAALAVMDEGVAGTIKRLAERCGGLSQANRGVMMDLLRENFYGLFVKAKVDPWADENTIYTTQASLDRREAELKDLTEVKMLENARAIGAAAAHGDLSENSEWKFALEERDMLQARAMKLQDELFKARVILSEMVPTDAVGIGSKVLLRRLSDQKTIELSFLGPWDSDLKAGILSYQTPVGLELMDRRPGETVRLKIEGQEDEYAIEKLGSAI